MFQVLDEMSELIYVVDLETYDLLYINHAGRELFGIQETDTGKCYQIIQGLDSPCPFCTNRYLSEDSFYTWEKTNPVARRHFLLKDKIIDWNGKKARVEIAFDMTEQEARRKSISDALELQSLITECAKRLNEADENEMAIPDVLRMSGEFLQSDRVYIFEIENDKMSNTYEWCAPRVQAQLKNLQNISTSLIDRWLQPFEAQHYIIIEDIEALKETSPEEYRILKAQDIYSTIAVPLFLHNELIGYIGGDNFLIEMKESTMSFLKSIGYFIASMLRQKRTLTQLEKASYYDLLTKIQNRNAYELKLKKQCRLPIGVVYLDINGMKQINNSLGHKSGDEVLRLTAKALTEHLPGADCYRIGGDEFLAVCEGISHKDFMEHVQQLKNYFEFHSDYCASLGTGWSDKFSSLSDIVYEADEAMFEDKKAFYRGRALSGRYRSQTDGILNITDLETLNKTIEAGRFHIYYQPQIDIKTRRVIGAEALVRYEDSSGNLFMPIHFIPLLEEARLISVLDFYVFEQVCSQLQKWLEAGISIVPVSTNFSRHTLGETGFADRLQSICSHSYVTKDFLEVEITETVEADDRGLFYHAIEQLNQKQFRISIDDFGVNNANLSLLTEVEFHTLKIDKHVMDMICKNQKSRRIVSALINICHELRIKIIAEGIETQEQFELLCRMNCDVAQGYLFSKPVPTNDFCSKFLCRSKNGQPDTLLN